MSVRDLATEDIKQELEIQGKCFLAFHTELDEVMDKLVNDFNEKKSKVKRV